MPYYEYVCECGNVSELNRPMGDRDIPAECKCGRLMRRVWGVGGVYIR